MSYCSDFSHHWSPLLPKLKYASNDGLVKNISKLLQKNFQAGVSQLFLAMDQPYIRPKEIAFKGFGFLFEDCLLPYVNMQYKKIISKSILRYGFVIFVHLLMIYNSVFL